MKAISSPIVLGLPDLCTDLFSYFTQIRRVEDPGDPDEFRRGIDARFRLLDSNAQGAGVPESNVSLAKYALAALYDETVLTSNWQAKESWSGNPLQLEYFNDFAAGEEFYSKLETIRRPADAGKADVLEVFYLCLALGFKGKYGGIEGMDKIRSLIRELAEEIRAARGGEPESGPRLSPEWEPPDQLPAIVKTFPVWSLAVGCAAVVLLVYIILSAISGGRVNGVLESLK